MAIDLRLPGPRRRLRTSPGRRVPADPPKVALYGMKQLYATDPDGYILCFQWPASE